MRSVRIGRDELTAAGRASRGTPRSPSSRRPRARRRGSARALSPAGSFPARRCRRPRGSRRSPRTRCSFSRSATRTLRANGLGFAMTSFTASAGARPFISPRSHITPAMSRSASRATGARRCSFGGVLAARGVRVRDPHRRQSEHVGEDVVRQRAAEVGQDRRLAAGRAADRLRRPFHPWVIRVDPRRGEEAVARRRDLDHRETVLHEVTLQRRHDVRGIDTDDVAQLAVRARARRDRVHRPVRIAADEGEDLEARPAEDALGGRETRLAPVGVDRRPVGPGVHPRSRRARRARRA